MKRRFPLLLLFFLSATAARADGVSPVLNLFHADTWLPATIVTAVIILIESLLLRWWLRPIPYWRALTLSFLVNAASSCAGSVLLLLFNRTSYFMWDTFSLVVPLFFITLATEIPLLRILPKPHPVTWTRIVLTGLGMNIISYIAVFALEIGLFLAFLSRAESRDERNLAQWQNPQLLEKFTGTLYGTSTDKGIHRLCAFDPKTQTWTNLTNGPSIDPQKWDVEKSLCVFIDREVNRLKIAHLPDFSDLREISMKPFAEPPRNGFDHWQGVVDLALSPDARLLALLFRTDSAVAYRDKTSHFDLGGKCRLIVLDVESGAEVARAPRRASGDLGWLPDSRTVLFTSFDDESLYDIPQSAVRGGTSHGVGYTKDGRFASRLYAFHLDTGTVAPFAQGHSPTLAAHARQILVHDGDVLRFLDPEGRETARLDLPGLWNSPIASPDASLLLAEILRHKPFYPGGVPVLLSPSAPDIRHALPGSFSYRYDWTF